MDVIHISGKTCITQELFVLSLFIAHHSFYPWDCFSIFQRRLAVTALAFLYFSHLETIKVRAFLWTGLGQEDRDPRGKKAEVQLLWEPLRIFQNPCSCEELLQNLPGPGTWENNPLKKKKKKKKRKPDLHQMHSSFSASLCLSTGVWSRTTNLSPVVICKALPSSGNDVDGWENDMGHSQTRGPREKDPVPTEIHVILHLWGLHFKNNHHHD